MMKYLTAAFIISLFMGTAANKKEWKVTFEEGTDDSPPTIYCDAHPNSKLIFNRYGKRIDIVEIEKLFKIVEKEKINEVDVTVDGGRGNEAAVGLYEKFGFKWFSQHSNSMEWKRQ
ncbi:hypothetical protein DdX_20832 [Ditylenchus destructor]|uniref:Uncharacterized protein n=1 Tax=Ditylenchus destructor TaxID=166010 RepID=A0AAD4MKM8_9BILA|nr:hypothetical protein DdX_20832 [Ditylenchus destructor]